MDHKRQNQQDSDLPPGLSQPAQRALAGAGYNSLEQLKGISETELKRMHGIGPKAIDLLHRALAERGWSFAGEGSEKR